MKTIGIDIGTTTISAVVMDMEADVLLEAVNVPNDSFIETPHSWERIQDTGKIVTRAQGILDDLLEQHPKCNAIGLTGQMHGIVYVDRLGMAVSPLYTWQDGRGNLLEHCDTCAPEPTVPKSLVQKLNEQYGIQTASGFGLATHLYNEKHGLVPENAVTFCTIMDYFGMVLTGRKKPLVHVSNAASFGFFDVEQGGFMKMEFGDTVTFPELTPNLDTLGTYHDIPVTVAIGDNQASFLGATGYDGSNANGETGEHVVLLNMGTGGQISVLSDRYITAHGIEARPYLNGKYLLVGASLCGGRAYAILESFFRNYMKAAMPEDGAGTQFDTDIYKIMEKLADRGREIENPMVVTTTFGGTRLNPEQRGSITNISEENFTPEGMVYGVLRGMATELYEFYQNMDAGRKIPVDKLVGSGNGLRKNRVLRAIFEELFESRMVISECEEEAACGAARSSRLR